MYKLLAIDIDGTLVDEDLEISPRNRRVLRALAGKGWVITLATGRMFCSAQMFAAQLELAAVPLVAYNGGLVKDSGSGEVYWHRTVSPASSYRVLDEAERLGLAPHVFVDDELYVASYDRWARHYEEIGGVEAHVVGDLRARLPGEPTKFILMADPPWMDQVEDSLRSRLEPDLYLTRSRPYFMEILHGEVSKVEGLRELGRRLGISLREMAAVGDSNNDAEMLQEVGWGIAMGNSPEYIKNLADQVTAPVQEDGLAQALEPWTEL